MAAYERRITNANYEPEFSEREDPYQAYKEKKLDEKLKHLPAEEREKRKELLRMLDK